MKKEHYTKEVLLDVMGSYLRQMSRNAEEYPTVVLSDIRDSIKSILKTCDYDGMYKDELSK